MARLKHQLGVVKAKAKAKVTRDLKSPDWDGLDMTLSTTLSDAGAEDVQKFHSWESTVQKDQATILKQGRLLRERDGVYFMDSDQRFD